MTSRLDKLLKASFRGVEFLVESESATEGGRKIVLHEYPNSSVRFIEDLGQIPPRFSMRAFVTGDNWINKASNLRTALNKKGPAKLVMPTLGSITLYALPYTVDASQTSVGIISFNLDFAAGKPSDAPTKIATTQQEVFEKGDAARAEVEVAFTDDFKPPSTLSNIVTAIGDVKDSVSETIAKIKDKIDTATLFKMIKKAKAIAAKLPQLINDPAGLAFELIQGSSLDPGIAQLTSLGFGVSGLVSTLAGLSDYGGSLKTSESSDDVTGSYVGEFVSDETSDTTPYWNETTQERSDRDELRRLIVRNQRLTILIAMYEQLAAGEYSTTVEMESARKTVEDSYKQIMLDGTQNGDALQSNQNLRSAIEDVRRASLEVLDDKDQQVFGLVDLQQRVPTSKFALAYNLYAEEFTSSTDLTDRAIVVSELNPDISGIEMVGTLTTLQNRVIL